MEVLQNCEIRISGKLLNMILAYREADFTESYNDTILRMLNRKTQIIVEQSERIKQLEYKIQQLRPTDASPSIRTSCIDERDTLENHENRFSVPSKFEIEKIQFNTTR